MSQLYARVFLQILDSSLADDWKTRHVFEDILKLVNRDGVCDMTRAAIARRTNVPCEIVNAAIQKLEQPDPESRDSTEGGRRLVRLDDHRDWGWRVVNWARYDSIRTTAEQREHNAQRMARYRDGKKNRPPSTPSPENQKQPQPQIQIQIQSIADNAPTRSLHVGNKPTTPDTETLSVEPPNGFPTSQGAARDIAALCGVTPEFSERTWLLAASRGWTDAKGQPIRSWLHYVASCAAFERDRVSRQRGADKARQNGKQAPKVRTYEDGTPRSPEMDLVRDIERRAREGTL